MKHFSIIVLVAVLLANSCGTALQTAEQRQAEADKTARLVQGALERRSYKIDINYMIPLRGRAQSVNSYSIRIDGETLHSHLPYFGVSRQSTYGGGNAFSFDEKIQSYTDTVTAPGRRTITATVRTDEDTFVYTLNIYENGQADITVHCRNRDNISYRGRLVTEND